MHYQANLCILFSQINIGAVWAVIASVPIRAPREPRGPGAGHGEITFNHSQSCLLAGYGRDLAVGVPYCVG